MDPQTDKPRRLLKRRTIFVRRLTSPLRVLPDFLIIGGQKCGTTSLHNYLVEHPLVGRSLRKEVHFFDIFFDRGVGWYRSYFPTRFEKQRGGPRWVTGESSPYYLFHPHAPSRIRRLLPNVKLIAMLRNPVDRAWSHYHHVPLRAFEPLGFEEAIEAEPERLSGETKKMLADEKYSSWVHQWQSYLARGLYADQLVTWLSLFPREQILIIRSEDFFEDPASSYKETLAFLGLPHHELDTYEQFLPGSYKQPMNDSTRRRLADYFRSHNRRLYELLGRDFGWDD